MRGTPAACPGTALRQSPHAGVRDAPTSSSPTVGEKRHDPLPREGVARGARWTSTERPDHAARPRGRGGSRGWRAGTRRCLFSTGPLRTWTPACGGRPLGLAVSGPPRPTLASRAATLVACPREADPTESTPGRACPRGPLGPQPCWRPHRLVGHRSVKDAQRARAWGLAHTAGARRRRGGPREPRMQERPAAPAAGSSAPARPPEGIGPASAAGPAEEGDTSRPRRRRAPLAGADTRAAPHGRRISPGGTHRTWKRNAGARRDRKDGEVGKGGEESPRRGVASGGRLRRGGGRGRCGGGLPACRRSRRRG